MGLHQWQQHENKEGNGLLLTFPCSPCVRCLLSVSLCLSSEREWERESKSCVVFRCMNNQGLSVDVLCCVMWCVVLACGSTNMYSLVRQQTLAQPKRKSGKKNQRWGGWLRFPWRVAYWAVFISFFSVKGTKRKKLLRWLVYGVFKSRCLSSGCGPNTSSLFLVWHAG